MDVVKLRDDVIHDYARRTGVKYSIEPQLPPDVLGLDVYLPFMDM